MSWMLDFRRIKSPFLREGHGGEQSVRNAVLSLCAGVSMFLLSDSAGMQTSTNLGSVQPQNLTISILINSISEKGNETNPLNQVTGLQEM